MSGYTAALNGPNKLNSRVIPRSRLRLWANRMTDRILDFKPFSSPKFSEFTTFFEKLISHKGKYISNIEDDDIDRIIRYLSINQKSLLEECIRQSARPIIGKIPPFNRLGDAIIAYTRFVLVHRRRPKLEHRFNDVLYHIKTSDEILNPLRVFVSDKEYVKLYIKAQVGDRYNIPTLAILRNESDVDQFTPKQDCVIKPTHSCGKYIFFESGGSVNKNRMKKWFSQNLYYESREVNYKHLQPKIIVEPLIFQPKMAVDYKVFCVHGVPKMIKVDFDRHVKHLRRFYDVNWQPLPFSWNSSPTEKGVEKPKNLNEILSLAGRLSDRFNFVRVDFYITRNNIFVGEITNCDGAADNIFYPEGGEKMASDICFNI